MLKAFPQRGEQVEGATQLLLEAFPVERSAVRHVFVPYRICPLGAHVDHQGGPVLGRTIPTGTVLVYMPLPDPEFALVSRNFPGMATFTLGTAVQPDHWARYALAAALVLGGRYTLSRGFMSASSGTLVGAGLGSSASMGLAYLKALADVNDLVLTTDELIDLDYELERIQLGLNNGIQDQSNVLHGQPDSFVYTDTRHRQARLIPDPPDALTVGWLIIFSGISRELTAGGGFNQRVAECQAAARFLDPAADILSDVSPRRFAEYAPAMPELLRRRAQHYFGEVARVRTGSQAWPAADFARFGALMNESCVSSIDQYESGHQAIIALQEIACRAPGIYGSRFSGGGYGGCLVGLVDRDQAGLAADHILSEYRQQYPQYAGQAAVYWGGF